MAVLSEEQEMLRNMARDWATKESPVSEFRKVRAAGQPQAYNADAYAAMAEMGWAGIIIPEAHGGSDFGFLSAGLVIEELGKTLTASPLVATIIAASAILLGGSDAQKAKWLPRLASGETVATLAVDEGSALRSLRNRDQRFGRQADRQKGIRARGAWRQPLRGRSQGRPIPGRKGRWRFTDHAQAHRSAQPRRYPSSLALPPRSSRAEATVCLATCSTGRACFPLPKCSAWRKLCSTRPSTI